MNTRVYATELVCSRKISFCISEGILRDVKFYSGCPGSLQGISRLVEGMPVEEVIKRLKGIKCGSNSTSCPDQLAKALEKSIAESEGETKAG